MLFRSEAGWIRDSGGLGFHQACGGQQLLGAVRCEVPTPPSSILPTGSRLEHTRVASEQNSGGFRGRAPPTASPDPLAQVLQSPRFPWLQPLAMRQTMTTTTTGVPSEQGSSDLRRATVSASSRAHRLSSSCRLQPPSPPSRPSPHQPVPTHHLR